MLYSTYLSNLKNLPQGVVRVRVCRPCILSPSKELLKQYKTGEITWEQYVEQYKLELISNRSAYPFLETIAGWAKSRDVYLYCYEKDPSHCHRSILLEILKGMGAPLGKIEGG
jgi:uncharacterized protein YeaO (DUF488 family)